MEVNKSTRHQAIVGRFGEYLICNWLSRSGFEVALVDHTGIDIIAFKPNVGRLGISVKSRTRSMGTESTSVTLLRTRNRDREKMEVACDAFGAEPWLAIYVETTAYADIFLTSLDHYDRFYASQVVNRTQDTWKMGRRQIASYLEDSAVLHIRIEFSADSWWRQEAFPTQQEDEPDS